MTTSAQSVSSKAIQKARQMAKRNRSAVACVRCKVGKSKCSDYRPCKNCWAMKAPCQETVTTIQKGKECDQKKIDHALSNDSYALKISEQQKCLYYQPAYTSTQDLITPFAHKVSASPRSAPEVLLPPMNTIQTSKGVYQKENLFPPVAFTAQKFPCDAFPSLQTYPPCLPLAVADLLHFGNADCMPSPYSPPSIQTQSASYLPSVAALQLLIALASARGS
jgi:hypothetical protein